MCKIYIPSTRVRCLRQWLAPDHSLVSLCLWESSTCELVTVVDESQWLVIKRKGHNGVFSACTMNAVSFLLNTTGCCFILYRTLDRSQTARDFIMLLKEHII